MDKTKLIAPKGSTTVSVDGQECEVVDGVASVPHHAVEQLVGAHGFTPYSEEAPAEPEKPADPVKPLAPAKESKQEVEKAAPELAGTGDELKDAGTLTTAETAEPIAAAESVATQALPWAK